MTYYFTTTIWEEQAALLFCCPFYPILSCKVSFHSTKFSTDRGYATSIDMNIYLWKEDIEDGESVMTAKYRPVEYILERLHRMDTRKIQIIKTNW